MTKKAGKSSTAWLDKHGLSDKHRLFVLSYPETLNTAEAAREAGYKHLYTQGPRLFGYAGIARAAEEASGATAGDNTNQTRLLRELLSVCELHRAGCGSEISHEPLSQRR